MNGPPVRRSPPGGAGFVGAAENLRGLYRPQQFTAPPRRRKCPYHDEVANAVTAGLNPNAFLYAGPDCWQRAERRRSQHGPGSALVLPRGTAPEALRWPPVDALVVDARDLSGADREALARALVRDGVRYACIVFEGGAINVRASWSPEVAS